ncbi:DNA damage-binding protein 1a [Orobanche minor]
MVEGLVDEYAEGLRTLTGMEIMDSSGRDEARFRAILAMTNDQDRLYNTYTVTLEDKDSSRDHWQSHRVAWPHLILPLPAPVCGFLLLGWQSIAYCSASCYEIKAIEHVTIKSYDVISDWRYLVLDEDGRLHLLTVDVKEERYKGLKLKNLGQTSVPGASTISILGSHLVYVSSGHGDSQLLKMKFRLDQKAKKMKFPKLKSLPDAEGSYVETVESYVNIGPIRDFSVVDLERLGQGTVVTLSGSIRESSLRIIRHGFEMNILASVKEGYINGLWSLRSPAYDTCLVVSYPSGTRVFATINGVLKETNIEGFPCELETLLCHDAVYDQLVQGNIKFCEVTSNSVRLVSWAAKNLEHEISFPLDNRISVATANLSQILCSSVRSLVYVQICDGKLNETKQAEFDYDVSCLNINPIGENPFYTELAAVGLWNDKSVGILSLTDLKLLSKEHIEEDVVVRSVLLCAFEGISYLMCGLGDGNLLIYSLNLKTGELSDRKKVSLGSSPLTLQTFTLKNTTHVFAACGSPTVIYSINKKLLFSQLDHPKEVNFVCPFNSAGFPDSLAFADTDGITLCMIEYQMPHIRTISFQESVQCISFQHSSRTIALCRSNSAGMGSIQLLSDQTFDFISSHSLRNLEIGLSIVSCSFVDDDTIYYCVGTSYEDQGSPLSSSSSWSSSDVETKGRILVFVVKDRQLELVAQKETNGPVESLICFNGKLLASVQKEIHLYMWIHHDDGAHVLELECQTDGSYRFPLVATRGNLIVVGSGREMKVSVLMYKPYCGGSIEEIAYHDANWATAVEILDEGNTYLLADRKCNLVTIEKDNESASNNQLLSCPPVGSYHVGHFVNQFKHGSLVIQMPDSNLDRISTCIFGTANGAIGLIASLPHDQYLFLADLQSSLRRYVRAIGDHKEWRSDIHDEYGTYSVASMEGVRGENFLDGDLIESFLCLNLHEKEIVSAEIKLPVEELIKRVEELTRLRWGC